MYLDERERKKIKKQMDDETKFQIEIDSLKEGFRVVVKAKVIKEWRKARFTLFEQKKKDTGQIDEDLIDTQNIDAEIDKFILEALVLKIENEPQTRSVFYP